MRIIEFVTTKNIDEYLPTILLIDLEDISTFEQIPHYNDMCKLITKTNQSYYIYGTYKTVTNRFFYALSKKHNIYEDDTIRPSIRVFHRPNLLEVDVSFFDKTQLKAFIEALDPNFDKTILPAYTQELFNSNQ